VLARAWRPYSAVLGRVAGRKGYHDAARHPEGRRVPGLVLFRFDAPLFFANADVFHERLEDAIDDSPTPVRTVVLAAEPITDVDTTAADVLAELHVELAARGIGLWFAELKGPAKDALERYGLLDALGRDRFYPTLGQAVRAHVAEQGIEWRDWEDA
jgi:MFS superfamily sulfate permease-like transporter